MFTKIISGLLSCLGLDKKSYTDYLKKADAIRLQLIQERKQKNSYFLNSFDDNSDAYIAMECAGHFKKYKKILIIGTGGSSLGGKALSSSLNKDRLLFDCNKKIN